jgi:hypothetical protein
MSDTKTMGGLIDRHQIITAGGYFLDERLEKLNGNVVFRGVNEKQNADENDTDWIIWKYSYSDGELVRKQGPREGPWKNRYSLGWGQERNLSSTGIIKQTKTKDAEAASLLFESVLELKKISLQLSIITENTVTNEEID